ncbi:N-acetyltransferase [Parasphingorhabdus litoris]|uniref:N-acetyltransferase n=1 Tax=Parasphingorhabdus litoris TaxID=394733 RepID=UPI001E5E374C|nr:N-acetyltransferase [Parasphingorhabdus litoris]
MSSHIDIQPVTTKAQLKTFVELAYQLNGDDSHWIPPLKSEVYALLNPKKNPFFEHATVQLYLAKKNGEAVGRISAHIDHLALEQPVEKGFGPGTGNWGLLEADSQETAAALIDAAEKWLKSKDMHRVVAPISLSVWDEPGLLTRGHDHSPTVMMGHHKAVYQDWIEGESYKSVKELITYHLPITDGFPPLIDRIVKSGERNSKLKLRKVEKAHFDRDAKIIMNILNDAWSDNWGFVPLTDHEIAHVGVKLKPIVYEDLIMIAEYEGKPVAFMMTLPDLNDRTKDMNGSLLPFNWAKLLWWLKFPKSPTMRVPLMGVVKELQNSRVASQMAFMMIEYIRREAVAKYGAVRGEIGWILDDNQGMVAIADAIESKINRVYTVYEKAI